MPICGIIELSLQIVKSTMQLSSAHWIIFYESQLYNSSQMGNFIELLLRTHISHELYDLKMYFLIVADVVNSWSGWN